MRARRFGRSPITDSCPPFSAKKSPLAYGVSPPYQATWAAAYSAPSTPAAPTRHADGPPVAVAATSPTARAPSPTPATGTYLMLSHAAAVARATTPATASAAAALGAGEGDDAGDAQRAGQLGVHLGAVDGERRGEREGEHGGHGDRRGDAEAADGRPHEHGGERAVDERRGRPWRRPSRRAPPDREQRRQPGIVRADLAALRRRLASGGGGRRPAKSRQRAAASSSAMSRSWSSARLIAVSRYCGSSAAVRAAEQGVGRAGTRAPRAKAASGDGDERRVQPSGPSRCSPTAPVGSPYVRRHRPATLRRPRGLGVRC